MKKCKWCGKDDYPTYLTVWPPGLPKRELIWICRRHLSPNAWLMDAQTGNHIPMYGTEEYWAVADCE